MIIVLIALAVAVLLVIWACCAISGECSRREEAADLQARPVNISANPSHDPPYNWIGEEPIPCPAIQEAQKRLADLPQVVAVTPSKMTRMEAQELAAAKNAEKAKNRADAAAEYIRMGGSVADAALVYDYASVNSMRKALSRYGYRMNGQRKEMPNAAE